MATIGLYAPWVLLYREINAMFGPDSEVHVIYDNDNKVISLYVDNDLKASAIEQLIISEAVFGSTTVNIEVIPANQLLSMERVSLKTLFEAAFEGNPNFSHCVFIDTIFKNPILYVVFKNKVIQYYSDDLSDVHGVTSTLCELIAPNMFKELNGVYYCTDLNEQAILFNLKFE